jgi:hypothetical protein
MAKVTIKLQEKYKKGVNINKQEVLRMVTENLDKITMEVRERTAYSDNTEELIISIRY